MAVKILLALLLSASAFGQHCDLTAWKHVYHPKRLKIIKPCTQALGTLVHKVTEGDGDEHWQLKLDPQFANLINAVNVKRQKGFMVIEPICLHKVTQADAVQACKGFAQSFPAMKVGAHVLVTGALVEDLQHGGWREFHAPTKVEIK